MDCGRFEKMIPAFLNDTLEYQDLKQFLEHLENCSECREELTIQVLILEGMARLEEGSAFDLQKGMERRMEEARRRIRFHRMIGYINITFLGAALLAVLIVFWVFTR